MKQPVTIQWYNTSTKIQPTHTTIQRSKRLCFNHTQAEIEVIASGDKHGLDPRSETGYYIDDDVELNECYSYRVITHQNDLKAASVSTDHIYVYDLENELGYTDGAPATVCTYNINTSPVLHLDACRLVGYSNRHNDTITSPASLVRFNKTPIKSIYTKGEPIFDSTTINGENVFIVSKTKTPVNQHNETSCLKTAQIYGKFVDDYTLEKYTAFIVVYDGYVDRNLQNNINLTNKHSINWSAQKISYSFPSGSQTINRANQNDIKIFCIRADEKKTHAWENNTLVYKKSHTKNKNKIIFSQKTDLKFLPNENKNMSSGLNEYIMFDEALNEYQIRTTFQYLCNKYSISDDNIDLKSVC